MHLGDDTIEDKGPSRIGFCFAEGHLGRHVSLTHGFSWGAPPPRATIFDECSCRDDQPSWDDMTR